MSLSSLIVQREIATIRQVEEALARQVLYGGDLVTNLLEVAKLDEATLTILLAESFGMAAATLGPLPVPNERARGMIPEEMATTRAMVPLAIEDGAIVVAVAEPLPKEAEDELSFALGLRVVQRIAPMVRVRESLGRMYGVPIERRLQRLILRLGAAPVPAIDAPPLERGSVPPSAHAPFRPSPSPAAPSVAPAAGARTQTADGFPAPPPENPATEAVDAQRSTFVQRDSSAPRPTARRRRGPMLPEAARRELAAAEGRDAILDLFFDYARQYFDYSALFVVHSEIAEGREAYGDGASRERVLAIGLPLDLPSVLAAARDAGTAVRVAPADDGLDAMLLGDMDRKTRGEVLVVPIVVRSRCVALLYGDSGDEGVDAAAARDVTGFAVLVGQRFEKMIVRKKLQGYTSGPAPAPALAAEPAHAPSVPPKAGSPASARAGVQPAPTPVAPEPPPPPEPEPPPPPEPEPPPPPPEPEPPTFSVSNPPAPEPIRAVNPPVMVLEPPPAPFIHQADLDPPTSSRIIVLNDRPPPENSFAVRRPSGPPIPREEPNERDAPPFPPPSPLPSSPTVSDSAPPSESFAVAPHRPPSSRAGGDAQELPSVIVDVDEAAGALVDRVVAMGSDEAAEAELIREGQKAMPAIMSRFPGPTVVDRARVEDGSLRAAECGPVLRLIAGQRRAALPFVLPIVGDGDPVRRYWATFLMTELAYPEVVDSLVPRLFDPDRSVRKVARLASRAVAEVAPEALVERFVRYYRDPGLQLERRIEMIETLGELRERLAVPLLIDALGDEQEDVAAAARKALMIVTRQDLGRDAKRWQAWWAQNAGRHRIEWLVDALMHEVPAIRRAAGDELKALTKEYFGYYDDLPRKEREKAQQRYRDWWATDGRMRFQRR